MLGHDLSSNKSEGVLRDLTLLIDPLISLPPYLSINFENGQILMLPFYTSKVYLEIRLRIEPP